MVNSGFPSVSVIMPVLNEEKTLERSVASLLTNCGYPDDRIELLLIDGGSEDSTLEVIAQLGVRWACVKLLLNHKKTTPHALNLGIASAKYDIILRADAHAIYDPGYIANSVKALQSGLGDNIGGAISMIRNESRFSAVLAWFLNLPLSAGRAKYRGNKTGLLVDTVWCGCWKKRTLLEVGCFDVDWVNNQDAELNARLIAAGYRVFLAPGVSASLIVRNSFGAFLKQYYKYGIGRAKTMVRHPRSLSLRQLVPLIVLLAMLGIFAFPLQFFSLVILGLLGFALYVLLNKSTGERLTTFLWIPPIAVGMNIAWSAGFLLGLSKQIGRRLIMPSS